MNAETLNTVISELRSQLYYYQRADLANETDFTMGRVVAMQEAIANLNAILKDLEI